MKADNQDSLSEQLVAPQKRSSQAQVTQVSKKKKKKSFFRSCCCCCFNGSTDEEQDDTQNSDNSKHSNKMKDSDSYHNNKKQHGNVNNNSSSAYGETVIHGSEQISTQQKKKKRSQASNHNGQDESADKINNLSLLRKSNLLMKSHSSILEIDGNKNSSQFNEITFQKSHSAENKSSMLSQKSNNNYDEDNNDEDNSGKSFISRLQNSNCLGEQHGELTWLSSGNIESCGVLVKLQTKHLQPGNINDPSVLLATHIASRVSGQIVVENVCSDGESLLALARGCSQLISLSSNFIGLKAARTTLENAKLLQKVELIQAKQLAALRMVRQAADVVIVKPDMLNPYEPNLQNVLMNALDIAESVVLVLPRHFDPCKLPLLLQQTNFSEKKFAVELQLVYFDTVFQQAIAFIGTIADVQKSQEIDYFVEKLSFGINISEMNFNVFKDKLRLLIVNLREKMRMRGVALLVQDCELTLANSMRSSEKNIETSELKKSKEQPPLKRQNQLIQQKIIIPGNAPAKPTLLSEFLGRIGSRRQDRIRSSGSPSLEFENSLKSGGYHGNSSDQVLKSLVGDISGMLQLAKSRENTFSQEGYESSFSYNPQKLDFLGAAAGGAGDAGGKGLLKNKYNQSMLETGTDAQQGSGFSPKFTSKLKELNTKRDFSKQEGEERKYDRNRNKRSNLNNSNNNNNAEEYGQARSDNNNNNDMSPDNEYDYESNSKPQYYSCSYDPNTLANSESSESNSLRTQNIGNNYNNQYSYSDNDDNDPSNKQSLGGKSNGSRSKSKNNQSGWADGEYSRSMSRNLSSQQQQQLLKYIEEIQDGDFCLEQEEDDEDDDEEEESGRGKGRRRQNKERKELSSYDQGSKLKDKPKTNFYSRIR